MTQTTFDVILKDTSEKDLIEETTDISTKLDAIYINTNNDDGTTNGFHTVNNSGDDLTLKWKQKDEAGNYQQIDNKTVVQGQSKKLITISDGSVLHRDTKVTAQLSDDRGDVRITGESHKDQAVAVDRGAVDDSSVTPTTTNFGSDISQNDDYYNDMIIRFISGSNAGEVRDVTDYKNSNGEFVIGQDLDTAPSDGDKFVVLGFQSTIARG